MKVQGKMQPISGSSIFTGAWPSAPPGSACRRGHERPACAAPAPDLRPGPLPAPSPRPSGPPECCRCAGPAAGSRPLAARRRASTSARSSASRSRPGGPLRAASAAPLHAHSGFHAQDHHVEHEGQAALDVARKAGCPPARAPPAIAMPAMSASPRNPLRRPLRHQAACLPRARSGASCIDPCDAPDQHHASGLQRGQQRQHAPAGRCAPAGS